MRQPNHFKLEINVPDPSRTLYFPNLPGRGGADDAVLDWSDYEGYKRVDDNELRGVYWRGFVGTFIAEHLGLDINKAWHVNTWPEGYALWARQRKSAKRHVDAYLVGFGGRKQFRSPREFAFHAVWLYDDNYFAEGDEACQCTLHTGRPQEEINAEWIYGYEQRTRRRANSHSGDGRGRTRNGEGGREGGEEGNRESSSDDEHDPIVQPFVYWSRSKKSLLAATGGPTPNPQWHPPQPAAAIRSHQTPHPTPSQHRPKELVWVEVDSLESWIRGEERIDWWPALVNSYDPNQAPDSYKVELLGVNTRYAVRENQIRTWQSQPLPPNFTQSALPFLGGQRRRPKHELNRFRPLPVSLDPLPSPFPRQYDLAILPYSIALREAARIAEQYTPFEPVLQADGSVRYKGIYYGPERIEVGDFVRLAPTREEYQERGLTRRWLAASDGASYERPLFGLILYIGEHQREEDLRFSARIFELQSFRTYNVVQGGNDNLPEAPEGFRFRELTPSMSPLQNRPIHDIASRYDPNDAVLLLAPDGRTERRRRSSSPLQGTSRRASGTRSLSSRGVEGSSPDPTVAKRIYAINWIRSREQGIQSARSEALRICYGNN